MRKLVMILGLVCVSILTFAQQGLIQKEISVSKNSQVKISSNNRNINVIFHVLPERCKPHFLQNRIIAQGTTWEDDAFQL